MKLKIENSISKILTFIMVTMYVSSYGQQEVLYSQYMFNTLALNPAYAGSRDVLSVTAIGRYQWTGGYIDGAPSTYSFSLDMPIKNEKMGLGLSAYNDAIGVSKNTGLNLSYSYRFRMSERTTLALGLQPTMTNVSLALSKVDRLEDITDNVFLNDQSKIIFNTGLGLYMSNDKGYFGISVPQFIEQKISANSGNLGKIRRHTFFSMGFVLGKGNIKVKPSTLIRYTKGVNLGVDGNINVWFRDKLALGLSGRKSQLVFAGQGFADAAVAMFELQLTPQIRFGYAYDFNNTSLNSKNGQSFVNRITGTPTHEWLLRYEFGYTKAKILTPRYF